MSTLAKTTIATKQGEYFDVNTEYFDVNKTTIATKQGEYFDVNTG